MSKNSLEISIILFHIIAKLGDVINISVNIDIIRNYGNLTIINCSFSNNNMSTAIDDNVGNYGFLLNNNGNASLIDCVMENNTLNDSEFSLMSGLSDKLTGAIYNNGSMNIINSSFTNNKLGFLNSSDDRKMGAGACVFNNATLNIENSVFDGNWAGYEGGAIYSNYNSTLTINNSQFNNNFAGFYGGAIYMARYWANSNSSYAIINSNFSNNSIDNQVDGSHVAGGYKCSGGALWIGYENGMIDNCEFRDNNVGSIDGDIFYTSFNGGAISLRAGVHNIINTKFINNTAECAATIYITYEGTYIPAVDNITIDNCIFEDNYVEATEIDRASIIVAESTLNLLNNEFKNNYHARNLIYSDSSLGTMSNNKFIDNNMTSNTIYSSLNQTTWTLTDNSYTNTTLNDTVVLDIPDRVYSGEPLTITGTYAINNPQDYDEDLVEKTKFNVYINGELDQTVDDLEFTLTPTSENMIITVQPTISQTRKSAVIRPIIINFTLDDVTATIGESTTITATLTINDESDINGGRIYFKVNGKILRDTQTGRILYADITDSTATLDYQVPKTWNEDTTIEAVYTGNEELPQVTSNKVNPTIATPEAQEQEFTVADATATAGNDVTITITTKNLDAGKVVLKVNGKTVKATDGKLYVKTTGDSVTFTYTVPKTLKEVITLLRLSTLVVLLGWMLMLS